MATRRSPLWVPERAEIIFIQYSPHVGKEMPSDHPMLVVSVKEFALRTGIVMGLPMTHAEHHADNPFAVAAAGAQGEVGYVLTNQPKSFDWRERNARPHPWGGGHTKLLAAALKRLDAVFGVCKH
ncbi:type II toxin-antitoxin system PemK/MazF family toxin [Verminephrobacter aporrectodeae]|uniref:type II toxin-antitoxin system PemK/MazF family toxin n=1 Tax=Verminephrobacter aporrectodeae TaxID=1110389 RepID=UPI002244177F|nr:type II toxin-antitoxin system PemK/MazF family toxin [Verminephrobacter aporrectodeae]